MWKHSIKSNCSLFPPRGVEASHTCHENTRKSRSFYLWRHTELYPQSESHQKTLLRETWSWQSSCLFRDASWVSVKTIHRFPGNENQRKNKWDSATGIFIINSWSFFSLLLMIKTSTVDTEIKSAKKTTTTTPFCSEILSMRQYVRTTGQPIMRIALCQPFHWVRSCFVRLIL